MEEGKYKVPKDEGEVLPNKLGLTKLEEIEQAANTDYAMMEKIIRSLF